ncbi:MAG: magnesium chelatase [Acidobacteria bacterium]|nr:MAG: magnesium chelatase [Acidobacteriota bacterium]
MPEYVSATIAHIRNELRKVIVGQDEPIEQILVALLAEGHALIEGVPGTAKTLTVKTLARIVNAGFGRIQFTPDLMPSDITGTNVFNMGSSSFSLRRGPVFTDILLADEINRTPPKTQAALLEAMEERQVTIDGELYPLSPMFTVLATENPIEYEGTYPLPEAAGFNARRLEQVDIRPLPDAAAIPQCRAEVRNMHMEPGVQRYVVDIVRRTRDHAALHYGASPRAAVALLLCAKALSAIRDRDFSTPDDVRDIARPVLRHRLTLRAEAELDGATPDSVITDILQSAEVPR